MELTMFTRFAKIVPALRKSGEFTESQLEQIADQLALACSELNPKFDYDRFIDATETSVAYYANN
jgi:hypothetical protein